ncbi:MAG: MFS transporter [Bacteroidia bacterium]|nr:MFS transporter [Bacteroidia bacterium]MCX7652289.1 MFS transporter [Bacteroidia bacterium]MDW8416551.1 MFS transporter [Bacteroidia bacterium]
MAREVRLTLLGVFIGLFLAALDQTVTATALPRILADLGGEAWYGWVGALYLLGSTIAAPVAGRLTEIISRRKVLIGALSLFGLGSFLCGSAIHFSQLLAFRFVQGLGGGALFSLAFTTLAWFFPPRERSRWAGLIGALFGMAGALGPVIGGVIAENLSWRWAFWGNLPFLVLAVVFVFRYLPAHGTLESEPMDIKGAFLMALWAAPLLLAFSFWGPERLGSPVWGIGLFMGSLLMLWVWIRAERFHPAPLFDLRLVQIPTFRYAALAGFFFGAIFMAGVTFLPLYLQGVLGYSPRQSGLLLLAFTVGAVFSTGAVGAWVSRHGRYKPILLICGIALTVIFGVARVALPSQISMGWLLLAMVSAASLLGPFQALLSVVGQNDIPQTRVGSATSALQFMRQVGSTLGLAVVNILYLTNMDKGTASPEILLRGIQGVMGGMMGFGVFLCGFVLLLPDRYLSRRHSSGRA